MKEKKLDDFKVQKSKWEKCKHENQTLSKRSNCNQYIWQCEKCGRCGNAIRHELLGDLNLNGTKEVDDTLAPNYNRDKNEERRAEYQDSMVDQRKEFFKVYNDYLRSHDWKARRTAVLRRDGYMCQSCLVNPAKEVHHLSYKHWGNEPLFELVSVCPPCHRKITEMDRNGNPGYEAELKF